MQQLRGTDIDILVEIRQRQGIILTSTSGQSLGNCDSSLSVFTENPERWLRGIFSKARKSVTGFVNIPVWLNRNRRNCLIKKVKSVANLVKVSKATRYVGPKKT